MIMYNKIKLTPTKNGLLTIPARAQPAISLWQPNGWKPGDAGTAELLIRPICNRDSFEQYPNA